MAQAVPPFSISRAAFEAITRRDSCASEGDTQSDGTPVAIGAFSCDLGDQSLRWNEATFELFGFAPGEKVDRREVLDMYAPESRRLLEVRRAQAIEVLGAFSLEAQIYTAEGEERWLRIHAHVESRNGQALRLHGTKQDITHERLHLRKLEELAFTDPVSGLGNRALFHAAFLHAPHAPSSPASRNMASAGALVLFDFDHFKAVNDAFGHIAGDACLARFGAHLRSAFPEALLLARIGGDEFAMVLGPNQDEDQLQQRLNATLQDLAIPFDWEGTSLSIRASFGLAMPPAAEPSSPNDLFRRADADLYRSKERRTPRAASPDAAYWDRS
mgnify:CR=1 FL=1